METNGEYHELFVEIERRQKAEKIANAKRMKVKLKAGDRVTLSNEETIIIFCIIKEKRLTKGAIRFFNKFGELITEHGFWLIDYITHINSMAIPCKHRKTKLLTEGVVEDKTIVMVRR